MEQITHMLYPLTGYDQTYCGVHIGKVNGNCLHDYLNNGLYKVSINEKEVTCIACLNQIEVYKKLQPIINHLSDLINSGLSVAEMQRLIDNAIIMCVNEATMGRKLLELYKLKNQQKEI